MADDSKVLSMQEAVSRYVHYASTESVFDDALALAFQHGCTVYDALYVALALQQGCRLVTADERLVNSLRASFDGSPVWLGDLPAAV